MSEIYELAQARLLAAITASRQSRPLRQALAGDRQALDELSPALQGVAALAVGLMAQEAAWPPEGEWREFVSPAFLAEWAKAVGAAAPPPDDVSPLETDFDTALAEARLLEAPARAQRVGVLVKALEHQPPTPERVSALLKMALELRPHPLRSRALSDLAALYLSRGDREGALQCLEIALLPRWGDRLENPARLREVEAALLMEQGQAFEASATLLQPVMAGLRGGLGAEGIGLLHNILAQVDRSTFGSLRPSPNRPSLGGPMANATVRAVLAWALDQADEFWEEPGIPGSLTRLFEFLEPEEIEEARASLEKRQMAEKLGGSRPEVPALLSQVREQVAGRDDPVAAVLESLSATGEDEALTRAVIQWLRIALIKARRHAEAEELTSLGEAYL